MPQLLTAPIFTTFAAGVATTYSVGSILAYAAVSMVASWALQALAPTPSTGGQGLIQNGLGASQPHEYVYGRVRKGGTITYMESTGDKNKFLHMILCLAGHEIDAVEAIYIDDEVVTLDASNFVTTSKWTRDGTPKIRILSQLGSDTQTVNTTLLAESNQVTSNFRGQGIAYLYIRLEYDKKVFQNGIPTFTARIRGKKVYNPSTGTTAWSANSALCIRDYLTSAIGLADPLVDDVFFNAARADCVVQVPIVGGTQNRYETHGVLSAANSIGDNLNKLLTSCAGTLFWGTGGWKLKVGAWSSPVKSFTLSNLRSDINLRTRNPMRDNFNGVQGTFNDAGQDYIVADYPPYLSATFKTEDAGFDAPLDLELPLTTNSAMAQRLAKLTLLRAREQMSFEAEFDLSAMGVQVGDNILLDFDRYGWGGANAKPFEVMAWRFVVDSNTGEIKIALTLKETSSSAFDWNAEDTSIISNNTSLVDPNADMALTSFTVFNGATQQKDGSWVSFISLSWGPPLNLFVDSYVVEWRINGSGDNFQTATTVNQNYKISPVVDGVTYEVRVAAINDGGFIGPYSATTTIIGGDTTAPGLPTVLSATGGYQSITLRWTKPTDVDFKHVEIYEKTSNVTPTVGELPISTSAGNSFVRNNLGDQVTRWYFFKSVDYSGNKSAFTSGVSATTTLVTSTGIGPGAVDVTNFASNIEPVSIWSGASLPTTRVTSTIFWTVDNKLYRWNGSAYVASVPTSDLTGVLSVAQFAQTLRPVEVVGTLPTTGNFQGRTVFLTTDNKLYRYTGSAWTKATDGADITANSITAGQIQAGAISTDQLAAGAVTAEKLAVGDFTNFVPNGRNEDFTSDPTVYWTETLAGGDAYYSTTAITSARSLVVAKPTADLTVSAFLTSRKYVPVQGGAEYYGETAIRCNTGTTTAGAYFRVIWYDANKAYLSDSDIVSNAGVTTTFQTFTKMVTAPASARFARFRIYNHSSQTTAQIMYYDRMLFWRANAGQLIVDGSITTNHLGANSITASKIDADAVTAGKIAAAAVNAREIAAGAITASKIAVTSTDNACGDFNCVDEDFWDNTSARDLVTTTTAGLGSKFVRINYSTSTVDVNSDWFLVEPDTDYFAQAYVSNSAAGPDSIVYIQFNNADISGTTRSVELGRTSGTTWTKVTSPSNLKTTSSECRARFKFRRTGDATTANGRFGAPKLVRKNAGELIVDGSITASKLITTEAVITGSVQIGSANVDTLNIAGQAVTALSYTYTGGTALVDSTTTEVELARLTITRVANLSTRVGFACQLNNPRTSGNQTRLEYRLYRGTTLIHSWIFVRDADTEGTGEGKAYFFADTNTSGGETTYIVTAVMTATGRSGNVSKRSLEAQQFKR